MYIHCYNNILYIICQFDSTHPKQSLSIALKLLQMLLLEALYCSCVHKIRMQIPAEKIFLVLL